MKRNHFLYTIIALIIMTFSSCNDYLNILPKGEKIPTTYADFEALLRDEYTLHYVAISQATNLLNDRFLSASSLSYDKIGDINYNWKEDQDRNLFLTADEQTYYQSYAGISTCNLLIEHANAMTDASDVQKKAIDATARVLRALNYYTLVNYYAANYDVATASQLKSVPLIESANIDAPHTQVSIQALYDFMINDITTALPALPATGLTVLHPGQGAAHTLLARIYLQMEKYPEALDQAQKALAINDKLYDWNSYYDQNKLAIEDPTNYTRRQSPMNHSYIENYYFRQAAATYAPSAESSIREDRAARFEPGDAKFASRWKLRTIVPDTYYYSITTAFHNTQGLTTVEAYLIQAECLARANQVASALQVLNKVRKTRIRPAQYQDLTATEVVDAVKLIQRTKQNELILSIVPFADRRRLNKDAQYATTLTKTEDGVQLSLSPSSHLWIMPFPQGAISNPGNGTIEQNVNK